MGTMSRETYAVDVEDVEYLRHGSTPLLARVFKPKGAGPFPTVVELHGGAWCEHDRTRDVGLNEPMAKSGIVVVALDFRMPPTAPYPASMQDIHYGVRWAKAQAKALGSRPDWVGALGVSSGGHQGMLLGMRPTDARYGAIPGLPGDGSLRFMVLCWPVIDPLGRYQYAKKLVAGGKPYPEVADNVIPRHEKFWQTEEAMAEGNPVMALERGEKVTLPPVLYLQGTQDDAHPRPQLDRFVAGYRKAGGSVELELYEGPTSNLRSASATPQGAQAIERIIEFVHKQTK